MTAACAMSLALTALEAGDLDALAQALMQREAALRDASLSEKSAAVADGETLRFRLEAFRKNLATDYRRMETLRAGTAGYSGAPSSSGFTVRA